jgi:LacI family transcriptional regulator
MTVTIKDIAKKIGKSTTTVSRALNDYDDISRETKEIVRKAAADLGYSPNATAQRLQKRSADTVGFILPTFGPRFSDPFFSEFIAGIGNKLAEFGIDLLVSTRTPGGQELDAYKNNVQGRRVDGFIVVRTRLKDERINYLKRVGFPFVAFGRMNGEIDFPFVDEDGEKGMMLVVDHLLNLGHTRIGVITPPIHFTFSYYRISGIKKRLNEAGIQLNSNLIINGDLTQRGGFQQTQTLLDLPEPPTAIIAGNDLMAFGAMSAAQERGLIVGKDISITGFDDIPMAEHSHPPLTTINQPIYSIGSKVCEMLVKLINDEGLDNKQVILSPSLIVRQSTGPPKMS